MAKTQSKPDPGAVAARFPAELVPWVALVAAWLVPGAGHVFLGRVRRGLILFLAVTLTFWSGVAMGGVMTVDRQNEFWWFVGQMCTGVNGAIAWNQSRQVQQEMRRSVDRDNRYREAISRSHDGRALSPLERQKLRATFEDAWLAGKGIALTAPMDTTARAYSGVAGMLNLMCIFDAVLLSLMGRTREPSKPGPDARRSGPKP